MLCRFWNWWIWDESHGFLGDEGYTAQPPADVLVFRFGMAVHACLPQLLPLFRLSQISPPPPPAIALRRPKATA